MKLRLKKGGGVEVNKPLRLALRKKVVSKELGEMVPEGVVKEMVPDFGRLWSKEVKMVSEEDIERFVGQQREARRLFDYVKMAREIRREEKEEEGVEDV